MAASGTADNGAQAPAKNSKKLLVIGLVVVLLIVAGAGAFLMLNQRHAEDDQEAKAVVVVPTFLPLENFVVNLADPGGDRFIQLGVTLELRDEKVADQVKQFMPSIRDGILRLVSQRTADELLGREGKEQLAVAIREEVARPLQRSQRKARPADDEFDDEDDAPRPAPASPVRRVLFSSFIIQ